MTEPITRLFERAERAGDPLPVPETAGVVARARRIRARRRLLAAAGTAAAVIAAVGAVHLLAPGAAPGGGLPAMSPTASDRALGRSADGLLLPVDLGPVGWTRDPGAATAGPLTDLSQPGCAGGSTGAWSALGENGQTAMFRGRTPTGAEWIASETVVATLGARSRQQISGLLHATSTGCTALDAHTVVLAANDTMLISGTLLPSGAVGYAQGYALSGSAWVTVDTLPGGAIGGVSLPGQTAWLTDVIASAVERVTGTRPVTPPPNAAARRAAAAGASASIDLSNDIRTIAPAPAGTAPAGTGAPRGFLPLAALGTTGAWTVGDQPTDRVTANATTITLPVVGPVAALSVTAPGGQQLYRGWTGTPHTPDGGNEWILSETVIHLNAAQASSVRQTLTRLRSAGPTGIGEPFGAMTVVARTGTSIVLTRTQPSGHPGISQAWALRGTVLVQLDTLPGGAGGGRDLPGGTAWLAGLLDPALTAATR